MLVMMLLIADKAGAGLCDEGIQQHGQQ